MSERPLDQYVALPPLDACAELHTTPQGLSDAEAAARLTEFGPNALASDLDAWSIRRMLAPFVNWITMLLLAAGVLAFISETRELGYTIILVALLNGLFTIWQEYQAERAIVALRHLLPETTFVRRDARPIRVPTSTIVPGDILPLSPRTVIVADGYLVTSEGLRVRQTMLTGNSAPVTKEAGPLTDPTLSLPERPNLLLAGTQVVEGQASLLVVATGMKTQLGLIARDTVELRGEQSPFVRALNRLAGAISRIAIAAGVITFLLMVFLRDLEINSSLIFAISMIVAFVPEGLLPTVTLALALARRRLERQRVLVKHLADVESFGSATILCLDKTDALVTSVLTVTEAWAGGQYVRVTGNGEIPEGQFLVQQHPIAPQQNPDLLTLLRAAALCNNARLVPPDANRSHWQVLGGAVEGALLIATTKAGISLSELSEQFPRIHTPPSDQRRRTMSVVVGHSTLTGGETLVYLRGFPSSVLGACTKILRHGKVQPLDNLTRSEITTEIDRQARAGNQVLALAKRQLTEETGDLMESSALEHDMIFLGFLSLQEPPQPEVEQLVSGCQRAGIRILLTTGAYGLTAEASGRRAGIITQEHVPIVPVSMLYEMSDEEIDDILRQGQAVFSQLDAISKRRIVSRLQHQDEIVAFLGDSINDAPALKQADIGVAVSSSGTTVALAAADMVLDANHPAGLLKAVEEGRAIFHNVQKLTTYIFTHNVAETIAILSAVLAGLPLPLTVVQVLAIDLGSELFPSIALSTEHPEPGVLDESPRDRDAPLLDRPSLLRIFWMGVLEAILAMIAFFIPLLAAGWSIGQLLPNDDLLYYKATTMVYAAIVLAQVGMAFASRTQHVSLWQIGLFSNRALLIGVSISVAVMLVLIYVPPLADAFNLVAPSLGEWALLLTYPVIMFGAEELRKLAVRRAP